VNGCTVLLHHHNIRLGIPAAVVPMAVSIRGISFG
jgi:hypothetical protein